MNLPVVQIDVGKVRGVQLKIVNGDQIFAFRGIPFAQPPVGELRFKAPKPVEPWTGIKDCIVNGNESVQAISSKNLSMKGTEDCLHLNVYTKTVDSTILKPVIFFIHGGAFIEGSSTSDVFGPDYLLMEDVILVTTNYRLGIFGFLTCDDPSLELFGNAGLKDQRLALQWVQRNIKQFGGDPNNVTLAGESAGSLSVHCHILSPSSKGLFHKAILQSGTAMNAWAYGDNNITNIMRAGGVQVNSDKEALEVLKDLPTDMVYEIQMKYNKTVRLNFLSFTPSVEKENPTAFLTVPLWEPLLTKTYNKVPIIVGYCNREGLIGVVNKLNEPYKKEPASLEETISLYTGVNKDWNIIKRVIPKVEKLYFGSCDPEAPVILLSDLMFIGGIIATAEYHAASSSMPVYLYRFSVDGNLNLMKKIYNLKDPGCCHSEDLNYEFKSLIAPMPPSGSLENQAIKNYVGMFTNFAKYSDPTPPNSGLGITWKPVTPDVDNFVDIGPNLTVGVDPEPERMRLWREFWTPSWPLIISKLTKCEDTC